MANLKVFVSSTCYDLGIVRSQLRGFVSNFGYEPVMSDFSDVLFDPRSHTHTSCIQEVSNCDMLILIIGSRFGGKVIPDALELINIDFVKGLSKNNKLLEDAKNISITQLEVLKAIESEVPVFTFIDNRVLHDHLVYEKNKESEILDNIIFPSIEKKETAKYIFEFINFLRHRTENNNIVGFSKMEDIETFLRKQWSGLLQRLLYEQRFKKTEERRMDYISNQIADIKTAIMTSISSTELKETARAAVKFRRVIQFLSTLNAQNITSALLDNISWDKLFEEVFKIERVEPVNEQYGGTRAVLICEDGTYYELRYPLTMLNNLKAEWEQFNQLDEKTKKAVIDVSMENNETRSRFVRYVPEKYKNGQADLDIKPGQDIFEFLQSVVNNK